MGIIFVEDLVKALLKLNQKAHIVLGDQDKTGRSDLKILGIIRKEQGFDDSNEYYYALYGVPAGQGCFKY